MKVGDRIKIIGNGTGYEGRFGFIGKLFHNHVFVWLLRNNSIEDFMIENISGPVNDCWILKEDNPHAKFIYKYAVDFNFGDFELFKIYPDSCSKCITTNKDHLCCDCKIK